MDTKTASPVLAVELSLAMTRLRARLRFEQAALTTGQTMSQLSVLGRIAEREPITASELAHAEHVRPQSMAEIVSALRRQDLIRGEPDLRDGRKIFLTVTDSGRRLIRSIVDHRGAWLAQAIEQHLSEADRDTLAAAAGIMSRLADSRLDGNVGEVGA